MRPLDFRPQHHAALRTQAAHSLGIVAHGHLAHLGRFHHHGFCRTLRAGLGCCIALQWCGAPARADRAGEWKPPGGAWSNSQTETAKTTYLFLSAMKSLDLGWSRNAAKQCISALWPAQAPALNPASHSRDLRNLGYRTLYEKTLRRRPDITMGTKAGVN